MCVCVCVCARVWVCGCVGVCEGTHCAGLVVANSLSSSLARKGFMFPSFMKLSFTGYKILG